MSGAVQTTRGSRVRRGFTLTEMMFSIGVVILLMSLLVVGLRMAARIAGKAADQQAVASLVMATEQFKQDFGFPPPLVQDNDPGIGVNFNTPTDQRVGPLYPLNGPSEPVAFLSTGDMAQRFPREEQYLRGRKMGDGPLDGGDYRFSTYSLAYYLLGALGTDSQGNNIDGVAGAGFLQPNADGTFRKTGGKKYQPLFNTSRGVKGVVPIDAVAGRIELQDRRGVPFRYYKWRHGRQEPPGNVNNLVVEEPADLNVPAVVGDPVEDPSLRNAEYAIVAAGRNGVFGDWWDSTHYTETPSDIKNGIGASQSMDDDQAARAGREDNVVGVGR
jgi:type II secretory pathway pseudopilin PulG